MNYSKGTEHPLFVICTRVLFLQKKSQKSSSFSEFSNGGSLSVVVFFCWISNAFGNERSELILSMDFRLELFVRDRVQFLYFELKNWDDGLSNQ